MTQQLAWLEVTDDDQVLFIESMSAMQARYMSTEAHQPWENIADHGGIAYAEEWAEEQGWELIGEWMTSQRFDGSWQTTILIGMK